jgi:hypothetical protein
METCKEPGHTEMQKPTTTAAQHARATHEIKGHPYEVIEVEAFMITAPFSSITTSPSWKRPATPYAADPEPTGATLYSMANSSPCSSKRTVSYPKPESEALKAAS